MILRFFFQFLVFELNKKLMLVMTNIYAENYASPIYQSLYTL